METRCEALQCGSVLTRNLKAADRINCPLEYKENLGLDGGVLPDSSAASLHHIFCHKAFVASSKDEYLWQTQTATDSDEIDEENSDKHDTFSYSCRFFKTKFINKRRSSSINVFVHLVRALASDKLSISLPLGH
jgi:hypothetical protein